MQIINIGNQAELDAALAAVYTETTTLVIEVGSYVIKNVPQLCCVELHGSASATLCGSASATLWDSASATLHGSSSATLYGSASATLYGSASATLHDNSVAIKRSSSAKASTSGRFAVVVDQASPVKRVADDFFDRCESVPDDAASVYLYKSVHPVTRCDFRTGAIKYEGTVTCPDWNLDPTIQCGQGLHLCATPEEALRYNDGLVLRCRVARADVAVYLADFSKVRCRCVKVEGEYVAK